MVTFRVTAIMAGLIGMGVGITHAQEGHVLPPQFKAENISSEMRQDILSLTREGHQSAQQTIETGEMDWLEEISSQVDIGTNPLDKTAVAAAAAPSGAPEEVMKHPLGDGFKTFVFVSWSMGETTIRDILDLYDGEDSTAIVFRGVPEGQTLAQGVMAVQALSKATQSALPVLLDPIAFQKHGITSVPSIAIETPDGSTQIKAAGTFSTRRLGDALDEGQTGDLGQLGPTMAIIEPDLIEVAKQKMEDLDFDAMKEKAIDSFWHKQSGQQLPTALEDSQRRVDPTVIIHQDILDSKGDVVTPAGEINPLDLMPFDQKLIIIDPDQPWQVALAADEVKRTHQSITVTVMATRIDPERGWDLFESTQDTIDAALYLLPSDMASRFQIQKVPSIVTADSRHFVVTEISQPTAEERSNGM